MSRTMWRSLAMRWRRGFLPRPLRDFMEVCAVLGIGAAVMALWSLHATMAEQRRAAEAETLAREADRVNRAWALVAEAKEHGSGNIGLAQALETLHRAGQDLRAINLQGAYLVDLRVPGADLTDANFSPACAPVIGAEGDVDDAGCEDNRTVLDGAVLAGAILFGANLSGADLFDVDLSGAELAFADLGGARNWDPDQIAAAQTICATTLPDGAVSYCDCPDRAPLDHREPNWLTGLRECLIVPSAGF